MAPSTQGVAQQGDQIETPRSRDAECSHGEVTVPIEVPGQTDEAAGAMDDSETIARGGPAPGTENDKAQPRVSRGQRLWKVKTPGLKDGVIPSPELAASGGRVTLEGQMGQEVESASEAQVASQAVSAERVGVSGTG